jgi:hypothetical protein
MLKLRVQNLKVETEEKERQPRNDIYTTLTSPPVSYNPMHADSNTATLNPVWLEGQTCFAAITHEHLDFNTCNAEAALPQSTRCFRILRDKGPMV